MNDLIDRKHLIKNLNRFAPEHYSALINSLILKEPTVDAEPIRHGKWIDEGYYADYANICAWHCSECNWHMLGYSDDLFDYCPSCGAKMKVRKNEADRR